MKARDRMSTIATDTDAIIVDVATASPSAHGARCSDEEIGGNESPALRKRFFLDRGRQRVARARSIELAPAFF